MSLFLDGERKSNAMADHDYKSGGWKDKYVIFKRCDACGGTGTGPCTCPGHGVGDCLYAIGHICDVCHGSGLRAVDKDAVYFVLRLDGDPHARAAAMAYAVSVQEENPQFAKDIVERIRVFL
jgi:hypothetical protein